jgi:ribose transport system ATP-binding protein
LLTNTPILSLKNISKSFTGNNVLCLDSMDLFPGEVHCLVGENGAGKSTLIKIISGAYKPNEGRIIFEQKEFSHFSPKWAKENGINTIYQEIDLVPNLNGAQNICLGSEPLTKYGNIDKAYIKKGARKILKDMGVDVNLSIPIRNLKIAYQQLIAIAKALWLKSKVIILDEPTAVFTRSEIDILFAIIQKLKQQNIAILYISHHLDEIFEIGDRVTVLRDGNLVKTGVVSDFNKDSLIKAMVGRNVDFSQRNGKESNNKPVLLDIRNFSKQDVFTDINISLREGEIVGLAGLVGAGRTELARCLIGLDKFDSGMVELKGKAVKITSPNQALALGIGMLPESRKEEGLILVRPTGENIAYSLIEKKSGFLGNIQWNKIKKTVRKLIESFDIRPPKPLIQAQFLSGGNQQKVVFAKLIAAQCDILIMDEPTRGVDVGARSSIYQIIQGLRKEGKGILMISSDLTELISQTDRIMVMAKGHIVHELDARSATEEKILSYALQPKQV